MIVRGPRSLIWHKVLAGGPTTRVIESYCGRSFERRVAQIVDTDALPTGGWCKPCKKMKKYYKRRS